MIKFSSLLILFTLMLMTSCQSDSKSTNTDSSSNSEIILPPRSWSHQNTIDQIQITYSTAPFERTIKASIIPNKNSIDEGVFDLKINWLNHEYSHEIRVPIIEHQIYSQPFIEQNNTFENIIDIGYKDENLQQHVLYQITILGSDLQFKKIKDFYLVPKT